MFVQMGVFIITLLAIFLVYFGFSTIAWARSNKDRRLLSGAELLFYDGRTAYWKKRYWDAVRMLSYAAFIRPERAVTYYYLGLSYAALGAFADAERAYREALRRDPKSNIAWSELGDLYRKLNRWEDAITAYQQALQIKPDLAPAHYGLEAAYACRNMKPIRTDPSAQTLYVLGWRAWLYRLPALIVYAMVPPLLVAACFTAQDLALRPSVRDVGAAFFLGLFFIMVWMYWRYLQSRATRITLSPDRALLIVRTLNFTSRRIPISALEGVHYEEESNSDVETRIPVLTAQVRGGAPIKIDLDGRIPDEQAFKAIFRYSRRLCDVS